jgi:hypothetical protein
MLGDTLLHIACREGYDVMVAFMLDPATKSRFETLVRRAAQLCFMCCYYLKASDMLEPTCYQATLPVLHTQPRIARSPT